MRVHPPDGLLTAPRTPDRAKRVAHTGRVAIPLLQRRNRDLAHMPAGAFHLKEGAGERIKPQAANPKPRQIGRPFNRR